MNKSSEEIMVELKSKFNKNFESWLTLEDKHLEKTFIYLHVISEIGEILKENKVSKHHEICCKLYDEIFSDSVSSIYLASCGIDKPANIILRRVLELGVALIYLWDMPHITYAWQEYDHSLSFSEMLLHVNSDGYIKYIIDENGIDIKDKIFDSKQCQKIYGDLSDVVHGKITSFETSLPDKFSFRSKDWLTYINLIEKVLNLLIQAQLKRHNISDALFEKLPQAKKEFN